MKKVAKHFASTLAAAIILAATFKAFNLFSVFESAFESIVALSNPSNPMLRGEDFTRTEISKHFFPDKEDIDAQAQKHPMTQKDLASARLGRALFFSPLLSSNQKRSCSECHKPENSFTENRARATGRSGTGELLLRNTPAIFNMHRRHWFFWDGRAATLSSQAIEPLTNPKEHGLKPEDIVEITLTHFLDLYQAAFGTPPHAAYKAAPSELSPSLHGGRSPEMATYGLATLSSFRGLTYFLNRASQHKEAPALILGRYLDQVVQAVQEPPPPSSPTQEVLLNILSAFQKFQEGLRTTPSPFDRFAKDFLSGKTKADAFQDGFQQEEYEGLSIFLSKGQCVQCHNGPDFTDHQFHNIGLPINPEIRHPTNLGHEMEKFPQIDPGRALGVILAKKNPWDDATCDRPTTLSSNQESCLERVYLDKENLETMGAFKTPSLRNLKDTAPYAHDGRFHTLEEILKHYNELDEDPAIGHREETLQPLNLSREELSQLEAFLKSLSSEVVDVVK